VLAKGLKYSDLTEERRVVRSSLTSDDHSGRLDCNITVTVNELSFFRL